MDHHTVYTREGGAWWMGKDWLEGEAELEYEQMTNQTEFMKLRCQNYETKKEDIKLYL